MPHTYICRLCGVEYVAKAKNRNKYCSRSCSDKRPRASGRYCKATLTREYPDYFLNEKGETVWSRPLKTDLFSCQQCGLPTKKHGNKKRCSLCTEDHIKSMIPSYFLNKNQHRTKQRNCHICGKSFVPTYGDKRQKNCSNECAELAYKKTRMKAKHRRVKRDRKELRDAYVRSRLRRDGVEPTDMLIAIKREQLLMARTLWSWRKVLNESDNSNV